MILRSFSVRLLQVARRDDQDGTVSCWLLDIKALILNDRKTKEFPNGRVHGFIEKLFTHPKVVKMGELTLNVQVGLQMTTTFRSGWGFNHDMRAIHQTIRSLTGVEAINVCDLQSLLRRVPDDPQLSERVFKG